MPSGAHNGEDDIAFYSAFVGHTHELAATTGGAQLSDADGPLTPGRYLIQLHNPSDASAVTWIIFGKFEKGSPIALVPGPGTRRIPLSGSTIVAIETHVRKGDDDRIGVITSAGTATVYVTHVSRQA